jgi:hypothetical protein
MISIAIYMYIYGDAFQDNLLVPTQNKYFKSVVWPFYAGVFLILWFAPLFLMNNPELPHWVGYAGVLYYTANMFMKVGTPQNPEGVTPYYAPNPVSLTPLMKVGTLIQLSTGVLGGIVMLRVVVMSKHMNANRKRKTINRAHLKSLLKKAAAPVLTPLELKRSGLFLGLKDALRPFFHPKDQGELTRAAVLVLDEIESTATRKGSANAENAEKEGTEGKEGQRPSSTSRTTLLDTERLSEMKASWRVTAEQTFNSIFPSFRTRGKRAKKIDSLTYLPTMLLVSGLQV